MRFSLKLIAVLLTLTLPGPAQVTMGGGVSVGGGTLICVPGTNPWPVTIPSYATSFPSLEQDTGWTTDASSDVSPNPPTSYAIVPTGGGGSTMTLQTANTANQYAGWMAKKSITTGGQLNMVLRASFKFTSVSGIQAWEVGRRAVNTAGITDNGQTQLVPISGGLLEFDKVPSPSGGWLDTGCRFPMFVVGTTYNEELYYVNDSTGALSLEYVEITYPGYSQVCPIPSSMNPVAGSALGWTPGAAVMAFQPDIKPLGAAYNAVVTMSAWTWNTATQVATPTFSVAAGAVAPGTTTTPSDSTAGAVVAYTIDGTTPSATSYTAGSNTVVTGNGTTMIYRPTINTHSGSQAVPAPAIYGPMTIKAIGYASGLTPSAVATYAYTLTAPAGTGISACTTTLTGTKYLTANVSSAGTCMGVTAASTILNLNGHTLTYGTASGTVQSGTGMSLTSGSTTATCSTCAFTSGLTGLKIFADNYNTGGYQNTSDSTTVTYVSPTQLTLSAAPSFTSTNAEWFIASAPVYGIACDPSVYGTCTGLQVYNGTITQGNVADAPQSNVIEVNPHAYGGANGPFVFANLTANYSAPETRFLMENDSSGQDLIENNTLNIAVTQIFYRDGLQYPITFVNGASTPTTPVKLVFDNQLLNSPQGGVQCTWVCYSWNNYHNNTTSVQYANGYAEMGGNGATGEGAGGSAFVGNTILGATRGIELEEENLNAQYNQVNVEDSATVHDPDHNPTGCEIDGGYGIRTKDFSSGLTNITGELIDSNLVTVTTGPCGGQVIRYTAIGPSDSGVNSNNNYNLVANTSTPVSSFDTIDGAVMSGFTYSNETYNATGADASSIYNAYIWYDGGQSWTLPGLVSPQIYWVQGTTATNAAFSGTGTATCTKLPGGTAAATFTYNGVTLPCP